MLESYCTYIMLGLITLVLWRKIKMLRDDLNDALKKLSDSVDALEARVEAALVAANANSLKQEDVDAVTAAQAKVDAVLAE